MQYVHIFFNKYLSLITLSFSHFFLYIFYFVSLFCCIFVFFFQAEDGIRDADVTGVQTSARPIYDLPSVVSTTDASRCGTGSVTLLAESDFVTINSYASLSSGTPITTGTSFTTPSLTNTTIYYVSANEGSCSSTRVAVTAEINAIPTITSTTPASRCDAGSVTLMATASAGTLSWFDSSTGGTALGTGTSFTTPSIATTTSYYVQSSNAGCTSSRVEVVATVNTTPTIVNKIGRASCRERVYNSVCDVVFK